jgi:hypothetical protein
MAFAATKRVGICALLRTIVGNAGGAVIGGFERTGREMQADARFSAQGVVGKADRYAEFRTKTTIRSANSRRAYLFEAAIGAPLYG